MGLSTLSSRAGNGSGLAPTVGGGVGTGLGTGGASLRGAGSSLFDDLV